LGVLKKLLGWMSNSGTEGSQGNWKQQGDPINPEVLRAVGGPDGYFIRPIGNPIIFPKKEDYIIMGVAIKYPIKIYNPLTDMLELKIFKAEAPKRHNHVFKLIKEDPQIILKNVMILQRDQGFYTKTCDFLTREEARELALHTGQCKNPSHPKLLFSEDLW